MWCVGLGLLAVAVSIFAIAAQAQQAREVATAAPPPRALPRKEVYLSDLRGVVGRQELVLDGMRSLTRADVTRDGATSILRLRDSSEKMVLATVYAAEFYSDRDISALAERIVQIHDAILTEIDRLGL